MQLLEMSISAGVLIMLLVLLRAWGLQKLPKRIFVLLWIVVLIRLVLPGSLPIPGGIATPAVRLMQRIAQILGQKLGFGSGKTVPAVIPKVASSGAAAGFGKNVWAEFAKEAAPVLFFIWVVGLVGFGIYFAYSYFREYQLLAQALPLESDEKEQLQALSGTAQRLVGIRQKDRTKERLFSHDQIASPLVWGAVKQKIVVPKGMVHMEPGHMKYVMAHEMVHVRRKDNFWKLLSAAAVCIHWFNPMVWAMYFLFARDLELSCDERVIALYGSQSREEYAMALLALAENQNQAKKTLFCSGFGKNLMKERIVAIMKYKKLTGVGICCAVILMAGATTVFATNDKAAISEKEAASAVEELQEDGSDSYIVTKTKTESKSLSEDASDEKQKEEQQVEYYRIVESEPTAAADAKEDEVDYVTEATVNAMDDDEQVEYMITNKNGNEISLDDLPVEQTLNVDGIDYYIEYVKSGSGDEVNILVKEKKD